MVSDIALIDKAIKSPKKPRINLPNGETVNITHTGEVRLNNNMVLKEVLCVPEFKHNLLSVNKLILQNNCKVIFYNDMCVIQDCATQKIKGVGRVQDGLYLLVDEPGEKIVEKARRRSHSLAEAERRDKNKAVEKAVERRNLISLCDVKYANHVKSRKEEYGLWHNRLGHAPMKKLKLIGCIKDDVDESVCVCLTCPMAKFTKLPYNLSESMATEPFNLVHIDIWGPYRVTTRNKHRYFLTLVDDYTRATWVYLLKLKSESLDVVKMFAKNHFGKSIKVIRSDNALEFDDGPCREYFAQEGIIHQTSCVDRPQQNGRAERKHRNVLEMSRALRMQACLPLSYWGDCVLTAVHIINRLPSVAIKNMTPYERLMGKKT